jgi:hypothetical protein
MARVHGWPLSRGGDIGGRLDDRGLMLVEGLFVAVDGKTARLA